MCTFHLQELWITEWYRDGLSVLDELEHVAEVDRKRMGTADIHNYNRARLSDETFERFSAYITSRYGIKLPPVKQLMLESRLRKRLRELNIPDFEAYADYVFRDENVDEIIHMADVITTNKTDFFREPRHFDILSKIVLPELVGKQIGLARALKVWSAACSTGEEPYTLAMVLSEFAEKYPGYKFNILGTDLSTKVLRHAQNAVYSAARIEPVLEALRKKYLLRSRNPGDNLVRIRPHLRDCVQFQRLNFLEDPYPSNPMDIIFCRNVFIYFDRETQLGILRKMCGSLRPGGFLFIGHSETLNGMDLPLELIESTVYQKKVS